MIYILYINRAGAQALLRYLLLASKFGESPNEIKFTIVIRSPKDEFRKSTGRMKAVAQLSGQAKVHTVTIPPDGRVKPQIMAKIPEITFRPQVIDAVDYWVNAHKR